MRPVNLIPPEERRGDRAPSRTGALPYVLVGALVVALAAVTAVVLTGKQVDDRKTELADVEARQQVAQAQADALRPYADFASLSVSREETVTSLAHSRFDWDRVLRELALVVPDGVWLTDLAGTVSPEVTLKGAVDVTLREQAGGPALAIVGCATSHRAVAEFLQALRDIDGVTRVGVQSSERPIERVDAAGSSAGAQTADCRTRNFISQFKVVAAFDAVAVPAVVPAAPEAAPAAGSSTADSSADASQVADGAAQEQEARDSTAAQTQKANQAVNIIPGSSR